MTSPFLLSLFFGFGIFIEAYLLTRQKLTFRKFLGKYIPCLIITLFLFIYMLIRSDTGSFYGAAFLSFIIFSILFSIVAEEEILPEISEQTILSFTLVFWYICFTHFSVGFSHLWVKIALIPSIATLIISFINRKLGFFWKLFFYNWFLLLIIFFGIFYFSFGNLSFFFIKENIKNLSVIGVMATGMAFLYLIANSFYFFELFPIPGKHQSFRERIEMWKEHTRLLTSKYTDYQLKPAYSFLLILFQGGILVLNYFFKFVSEDLIISIAILLPSSLISPPENPSTYWP